MLACTVATAEPQNIRGDATGPTTAKGYRHADQFIHLKPIKPADNMYPVIQHPEQDKAARARSVSPVTSSANRLQRL